MLWTAAFISNIGTWMETVGVGILVTAQTGDPGWTGLVAAAGFLPGGLLGPLGGVLADRLPRRLLLLTTTTIQVLLAALLTYLAATGTPSPITVTLIVFAGGCAQAIGFPTYQTLLPDLVPPEDLVGAVALSSAQWNLGRVIGPALAGIVIGLGGYALAFGLNAISFFTVIIVIILLRLPPPAHHGGVSMFESFRQGVSYTKNDPALRIVVAYMVLNTFLAAPFIALIPAMSQLVFDTGAGGTAALVTAQGIGAVAMGFALASLAARFGSGRVLFAVLWGLPPALFFYAIAPTIQVSFIAILLVGFLYLGALSSFMSIAQLRVPAALRGRVLSLLILVLGTLYPLGSVIQGQIADVIGLRATTAGAAILMLAILAIARIAYPRFTDELRAPPTAFHGEAAGVVEAP